MSYLETPTREAELKNPYLIYDYCEGSHEADECGQNNPTEHVYLSGGDIYDDPSLLRRARQLYAPKESHAKGIGDMLDQHHQESALETPLSLHLPTTLKGQPKRKDLRAQNQALYIMKSLTPPAIHFLPTLQVIESPFPSRVKKQKKDDEDEQLFSIFKQIHINLPFLEAMIHIPKGAKVLKDLLSYKEKLEKAAYSVKLSEECSAIIQRSLRQKEGDPRSFTLPCLIRPLIVKNALADLGASINLMTSSLFQRLGISKLKPTRMSIQLANRSIKYHIGVCENLLVKATVDFVVLELDEDKLVPIILGRPFLATARAVTDIHEGNLSLRLVQEQLVDTVDHDGKWTEVEEEEDSNEVQAVSFYPRTESVEPLEWKASKNRLKPSSIEPPKLELKELPKHLEYAFLQENNQLLVVIFSALSTIEKARLLEVLKNHKRAISWSIAYIKGIDSSFCTHKILMEDEFKPRLIYPISDSPWVSLVQVVPNKGGITIVKNEKNELIPQRMMLERLAGHEYYCFLDGFSRYFQIPIALEDQEKTTFTCPYGTFRYKRMPFILCNAPATFQHCMTAIFHELTKDSIEVFLNDFSIFGNSFDHCLKNLEKMLKRCKETNLVLNWEKCHFMVNEGIVLGHKVSGAGIEVDKAKIKAISKLPYPTNVKAI
ncbi:DNA-directed DNA polymerase [Tanacetum coccineum]